MTEHKEDKAFEDYLAGRSRLSDSYARLKDTGPSEELDRRIMAEARREAGRQGRKRAPAWRAWPAIATLAVAGVAVLLTLDLAGLHSPTMRSYDAARMPELRQPETVARSTPPPAAGESSAAEDADHAAPRFADGRNPVADEPAVLSMAKGEAEDQAPADAADTGRAAFAARTARPSGEDGDAGDRPSVTAASDDARPVGQRAAPGDAPPADPMPGTEVDSTSIAGALAAATERVRERRGAGRALVSTAIPAAEFQAELPSPAQLREQPAATLLGNDPELWLEFIDVLLEQGEEETAGTQMRRFRDHFPDRPLDPRHEALLAD